MNLSEPGYLCPAIDEVISDIETAGSQFDKIIENYKNHCAPSLGELEEIYNLIFDTVRYGFNTRRLEQKMEGIRSQVQDLRSWGISCQKESEEWEEKFNEKENECSKLEERISEMESENHSLQEEIDAWNEYSV